MSEDNITALFRVTVAQAKAEGERSAYQAAGNLVTDLYIRASSMTIAQIKAELDALRKEFDVQSYSANHIAHLASRRLARAGMELRDDTTPR